MNNKFDMEKAISRNETVVTRLKEKMELRKNAEEIPSGEISIECFQKDLASDLHSIELPEVKTVDLFSDF